MFSQSCNCLPNKKQSMFCNQSGQNVGLLRTLSSKSYQHSVDHISMEFQDTEKKMNNNISSRTNIMDIVYSFTESSRIKLDRRYISTFSAVPTERSNINCKEILTHCNTMTTLPLARSYLVGGFVGSKSQIGRKRKNYVGEMNLWDIIRDLVDLVGNTPANLSGKQNHHPSSVFDKKCELMKDSNIQKESGLKSSNHNNSVGSNGLEETSSFLKQSYADVAKRPTRDHRSVKITTQPEVQPHLTSSEPCNNRMSVIEPISSCKPIRTNFSNRDRITSECSADSEDSFIVFEYCEDDNVDKDIYNSDDETLSCVDEVSQSDVGIVPSSNSGYCSKPSSKKVRFAEGKSLVKIHPMVTWNYAYRMARRGPWEMFARDSERFKIRIAKTEAVLKPILDPQHRSAVFRDRFSNCVR